MLSSIRFPSKRKLFRKSRVDKFRIIDLFDGGRYHRIANRREGDAGGGAGIVLHGGDPFVDRWAGSAAGFHGVDGKTDAIVEIRGRDTGILSVFRLEGRHEIGPRL